MQIISKNKFFFCIIFRLKGHFLRVEWFPVQSEHQSEWIYARRKYWFSRKQSHFTLLCILWLWGRREWIRAEDTIWESRSLALKSRWIFHHVEQPGVRVLSPNAIVSLLLSPLSRRTPRILNVDVWTGWHRIKNLYVCIEPETQTRTRTSILSGDSSDILCKYPCLGRALAAE